MHKVVLVRHGESVWNREGRYTGWTDVPLSQKGREEALHAGRLLKDAGFTFDRSYTSVLKRAVHTLWLILEVMDQMWIPVENHWQLNERHYGALQGLNKQVSAAEYGAEQVFQWRRSYSIRPPELALDDQRHPRFDRRYAALKTAELPSGESLQDTLLRVLPFWHDHLVPSLARGEQILISAHGNSLRALVKHLDSIPDENIPALNSPTGCPLVYEWDDRFTPIRHYYLE